MPEILSGEPGVSGPGGDLEAVLANYLRAAEEGRAPERMELLARHPDLAPELAAFFAGQERFTLLAAPLRDAVSAAQESTIEDKLAEGGRLGDFRLFREVGRGGMGIVYEAEQISLGRRVALKVLPFAGALDAKQLQRFKNEAHAAAHLQHQNIVPVYFVGCERGVHFYAMQFVEGQTLAALIQELRQLERGKGEAHREGKAPAEPLGRANLAGGLVSGHWAPVPHGAVDSPPTGPYGQSAGVDQPPEDANVTPPVGALSTERSTNRPAFFRTVANLGIQVAEALEHAHQLGVIHRDIKPANMMVDARGNLWVTDFGLAHCQGGCELTMSGDLLGTLRYMSPEQALAQRVLVDQRTDIYSLGATLYELLTLDPAFPGTDRQELLSQIAFEDPKPPRRLNKAIPAELETIVLKAMEKNPEERYGAAQELADDLRRYLEDKPIRARRPTILARGRKWAKRHWGVVSATLVTAVLVFAISTVFIWKQWQLSEDYRKKAVRSAAKAEAMNNFLVHQLLETAAGNQARGGKVTLDDVIRKAATNIDDAFLDQPEVEADVRFMIGNAYLTMTLPSKAEPQLRRAWELRERALGEADPETLNALQCLAHSHTLQGQLSEADELYKKALKGMRQVLSEDNGKLLETLHKFAWNLNCQGRWSEAENNFRECLAIRRRVLGHEDSGKLDTMSCLAVTLSNKGEWGEAENLADEAVRLSQRDFGEEDARTVRAAIKMAQVLCTERKGPEAEFICRKLRPNAVRIWGEDNLETLIADTLLIAALRMQDTPAKLDEAEQICRNNVRIWPNNPEINQRRIAVGQYQLGFVLQGQGKWPEAESELQQCLETVRRVFGAENAFALWLQCLLGSVLEAAGKKEEARTHLRSAMEGSRKALSPQHPTLAVAVYRPMLALALYQWAEYLLDQKDFPQAEEALWEISRIPRHQFPPGDLRPLGESLAALGWVLTKQGRAKEGAPFLHEGLEICRKYLAKGHWATAEAESRLGGCLAALGQSADAEKFLVTSYQSLETARGAPPPRTRQALERIIEFYETSGQADKAAKWQAKRKPETPAHKAEGNK